MMKMRMLLPLLVATLACRQPRLSAAECQRDCGGLEIPYPFGIGRGCYLENGDGDQPFSVTCNTSNAIYGALRRPTPTIKGIEVLDIDVRRGKLRVRGTVGSWCYNATTSSMGEQTSLWFDSATFRVSDTDNRLTVVGCNAFAYIDSRDGAVDSRYVVGCQSKCSRTQLDNGGSRCDGVSGCCQAPIPPGLRSFDVNYFDDYNSSDVASYSPCSYVTIVEASEFKFRTAYVTTSRLLETDVGKAPLVLDWAVDNQTCSQAKMNRTAYTCISDNSVCVDSTNGPGYLCNCSQGYVGNPYLPGPDGCQDINECEDKLVKYPCSAHSICVNKRGGFKCYELNWQAAISISTAVVVLGIGLSGTYAVREKRRLAAIKQRHFKQHGGLMLFEAMKSQQGRQGRLSFTLFTKEELDEATGKFDERHVLGKGGNGTVYRGELKDGRTVAIKRCKVADDERQRREFGKEVLILSQVNHRNIVKLYGCCLEVKVPILVYQFIPNGTLYQLLHGDATVPPLFAVRMKIAHEAAEALAYLHSTASPPIIHGDVKSPNILLDSDYTAKVSDFGASALAPTDEAHLVTLMQGTCGYLDPEYMQTCRLTDRSDVYSFGVVLLELLTRRKALALAAPEEERSLAACFLTAARDGRLDVLVDPKIKDEVSGEVLEMVAALAKRCLEMSGERRPSMRDVVEEIDRVRKLMIKRAACLLGDVAAHTSIVICDR